MDEPLINNAISISGNRMPISNGLRTMKQIGQERIICELSNLHYIALGFGIHLFHYFLCDYLKNSNEDFFLRSRDLLYLIDDLITFFLSNYSREL